MEKTRVLNFKAWLAALSILEEYIRNTVAFDVERGEVGNWVEPSPDLPGSWVDYGFSWSDTPEGADFWLEIHHAWEDTVQGATKLGMEVEAGIPLEDKLGMAMLLADLEAKEADDG